MSQDNVAAFEKTAKKPKNVIIAISEVIKVDPENTLYCYVDGWENNRSSSKQCSGITCILDTREIGCRHFHAGVIKSPHHRLPDMTYEENLRKPGGEIARWGQKEPIIRHPLCVQGEKIMKKDTA